MPLRRRKRAGKKIERGVDPHRACARPDNRQVAFAGAARAVDSRIRDAWRDAGRAWLSAFHGIIRDLSVAENLIHQPAGRHAVA